MDSTIILLWVFTWVTIGLIAFRLLLRKIKGLNFVWGDYFSMAAILCALIRLALVHVVLLWGTNNMPAALRQTMKFTAAEIHRRETASKFVLANRVFYNSYLWLQKLVLLDTYRRLLKNLRWEKATMISYTSIFAATYVAVQVVTFTECDPFNHYWIVLPDPGICCQAQLQLIVLGVLNIITDVMLIALPIPILVLVKRSTAEKLQLAALFAVGLFIVAITIARLPQNTKNPTAQVNRTTWASIEELAAAIVANAPVVYGLLKGRIQRSRDAASASGSTQPSWQRTQRKPHDEPIELQRNHPSKRGSNLGSKLSTRNYREIDNASSRTLSRGQEN